MVDPTTGIQNTAYHANKMRITEDGILAEFKSVNTREGLVTKLLLHDGELSKVLSDHRSTSIDRPSMPTTASLEDAERLTDKFIKSVAWHVHQNPLTLQSTGIHDMLNALIDWQPNFVEARTSYMREDVQRIITALEEHHNAAEPSVKELPDLIAGFKAIEEGLNDMPANQEKVIAESQKLLSDARVLNADKYTHVYQLIIGLPSRLGRSVELDLTPIIDEIRLHEEAGQKKWVPGTADMLEDVGREDRKGFVEANYDVNPLLRKVSGNIVPRELPKGEILRF